jgi:hypothetical protein
MIPFVSIDVGRSMPAFIRLIRFAKLITLLAGLLTLLQLVLIVGWQAVTFFNKGRWPALQLSAVVKWVQDRGEIYETASTPSVERGDLLASAAETLLQIPVVVPLLLALALLIVFFLWLSHIEKQFR